VGALVIAALIAAFLGTAAMGQFGLASMAAALGAVSWQDRLAVLVFDLQNFAPRYAILIAGGLVLPGLAATLVAHFFPALRVVWFALAGVVAVMVVIFGLEMLFGQPVFKGAQGLGPLLAQAVAGALGGAAMAQLARLKRA
jgi:hypothetical protein